MFLLKLYLKKQTLNFSCVYYIHVFKSNIYVCTYIYKLKRN